MWHDTEGSVATTMTTTTFEPDRPRSRWLVAIAAALLACLAWHGPIAQWADYHAFADTRPWLGLPNAANVLSNLPFALIGAWGMRQLMRQTPEDASAHPTAKVWRWFCASLLCTAVGSAIYHWAPGNDTLLIDRLPIAWACALLTCAFLAERIDARWSSTRSLVIAIGLASLAVAHWWWTERLGQGDLRAYLFVQFLPMLLVPGALALQLPRLRMDAVPAPTWCLVLALYAVAKGMEVADHWMFEATHGMSGHMLKHLLAAAAAACLVRAVIPRSALRSH